MSGISFPVAVIHIQFRTGFYPELKNEPYKNIHTSDHLSVSFTFLQIFVFIKISNLPYEKLLALIEQFNVQSNVKLMRLLGSLLADEDKNLLVGRIKYLRQRI